MHSSSDYRSRVNAVLVTSMICANIWLGVVLTGNIMNPHGIVMKHVVPGFGYPDSSLIQNPNLSCNQVLNQSVLLGQTGVVINWTIKDKGRTSGSYIVFHDTIPIITPSVLASLKSWTNNTVIHVPVNTTIVGWHNYTIFFTDMILTEFISAGNNATGDFSTAWVHVEIPPTIQAPAEMRIYRGTAGRSLVITITDPDSSMVWINVTCTNGSMVRGPNLPWNVSRVISIALNTTNIGYLNFTITVTDRNYTVQQQSIVWIAYDFPPEILGLKNHTVSPDAKIIAIPFRITDMENLSGNYTILRGGNPFNNSYVNATWTNNSQYVLYLTLNIHGQSNYQIIAEDLSRNKTTSTFFIDANDPPRIKSSSPQNRTVPNQNVTWVIIDSDNVTGYYTVMRNGTILPTFKNLQWTNDTTITVPVDTSASGFWNYTIIFTDGISTRQDTIIVSVPTSNSLTITIILGVIVIISIIGASIILGRKKK